ncbi:GtrA family protein [Paraburkholderia sp. MM5384-R2]|uniref:GtrA family protein n=1 Tax=Paraburkholderia sp. MM5384-R2 TaxID=2723097 RepID=UPI00160D0B19|nr:GtrA family protein [Paraburkholderia sp. MM5384-R2]MBB5497642.1 putative flippase GtrA [Paraburkholderia sp. MM5384-R2]
MMPVERVRLMRFGASGVIATGLHVCIALTLIADAGMSPPWANAIAYTWATAASYLLNTFWSFSALPALLNAGRFVVVSLGGLTSTALVSHLTQLAGGPPALGIALVVCVVPPLTFVAHRCWTYR